MTKRVCIESGCPTLTEGTRCHAHERGRDKARGTRQQRGYDAAHVRRRAKSKRLVDKGLVICWRCGKRISPLEPFDEGHCDDDRTVYHGPEHVSENRGARGPCPHASHLIHEIPQGGDP